MEVIRNLADAGEEAWERCLQHQVELTPTMLPTGTGNNSVSLIRVLDLDSEKNIGQLRARIELS